MNKEMLKGTIDLLILSLLLEKDNYGYEISRELKERTEGAFIVQEATLYLSLKRLEKQGSIESYWGSETQGGRRKYYRITSDGQERLQQIKQDWEQMASIVSKFT
ncbi:PadR family transcriptional regulator [Alkalihalobacillus sp. AL-G]|uniref:PadR family transcriptional regulator n=1 Tax=Alkalihalobacillus sp. AL-G TaxID=2926399 RepID=UPI0027298B23|nr:PadR family transcriptional regulator [Alkalihalobacillus sp. AL-G]WLD94686.1 PadR family transcriptional regulator [Alkalihalobacillus sp. AL-G]